MTGLPDFTGLSEEAWKILRRLRDRKVVHVVRPAGIEAAQELARRGLVVTSWAPGSRGVLQVSDAPDVPYAVIEGGLGQPAPHSYLRAALERDGFPTSNQG